MRRWPQTCRRVLAGAVLGLAVSLAAGWLSAMDVFLHTRLPLFFPQVPSVPLKEQVLRIPFTGSGAGGRRELTLEGTLYRPSGSGPFPLVVLSHGIPRKIRLRSGRRRRYNAQSWEFVSMGFAVVIPMRRGYGHSEGRYAENEGPCDAADFYAAGLESARDLRAAVQYVSTRPGIDARRLVLVGHSSGGFASLILASQGLPGVKGVINFAGGRGSMAGRNCSPERLVQACARAGRTIRVPTLWIYAENDSFFPPPLARRMVAAFHLSGGPARLVMLPPGLEEGHFLFPDVRGLAQWTPIVNRFLNDLGFPGKMPQP